MTLDRQAPHLNPITLNDQTHHWLAFSGGPDSLCLLHALLQINIQPRLSVVHIDHGLDPDSGQRAEQAVLLADQLGIQCRVETLSSIDLDLPGGPEAAARQARYARLRRLMADGDHLLTAHHADDQIETVVLRLLRASGARGLSGMRAKRPFEPGWLARPILHWRKQQITAYLDRHQLVAIDDPSNRNDAFDRNFLRNQVLPMIESRWPGYRQSVLRSTELMGSAREAMERQAMADFDACADALHDERVLRTDAWLSLATPRALEVIRHWCRMHKLEPPPADRLLEWHRQCMDARMDRQPLLDWSTAQLRRWHARLWLDVQPEAIHPWRMQGAFASSPQLAIDAPELRGQFLLQGSLGEPPGRAWQLDSGQPGDAFAHAICAADGRRAPHRSVNELLRIHRVPPWRRAQWPRLRIDGELAALGQAYVSARLYAWMSANDGTLRWRSSLPSL
ncbi:MAG: tRNA lysidine(34) synthetase TilS [Pseudomonadota bacterium]